MMISEDGDEIAHYIEQAEPEHSVILSTTGDIFFKKQCSKINLSSDVNDFGS